MNGKRVLRYVGNREEPEKELYGAEEIIHFNRAFTPLSELQEMAIAVNGLNSIKPLSFDYKSKMAQLVEPVEIPSLETTTYAQMMQQLYGLRPVKEEKQEDAEPEFEVNMMEALQGWRSWNIHKDLICSLNSAKRWFPDKAVEAVHAGLHHHTGVPKENCSCGIYAVNQLVDVPEGQVYGEVYGWGRYVRGEDGWRSQFAYPKCFHLAQNRADLIDVLRKYHVPIYIETPVKVYSPEEDGYEDWTNEENGDRGAVEGSGSDEEA